MCNHINGNISMDKKYSGLTNQRFQLIVFPVTSCGIIHFPYLEPKSQTYLD
jgi:hypothetical protein